MTEQCPYVGKKLSETDFRKKSIIILSIRRENGERLIPPPGTATIQLGDNLFVFGDAVSIGQIFNLGETAI